ncbi:MAG: hypothetical protein AAF725_01880, partial [Acidobacteriota bacterium]
AAGPSTAQARAAATLAGRDGVLLLAAEKAAEIEQSARALGLARPAVPVTEPEPEDPNEGSGG